MTPIFMRIWLMKMTVELDLEMTARDLSERLAHKPSLKSHERIAHIAFDFRLRDESGYRVDHDEVDRARTNEGIDDFECLFPVIGLGDDEGVDVDSDFFRVRGIEGVLGVDEGARAAGFLHLRDGMEREGVFPEDSGP
jgi:hypothetical protein